MEKCPRDTCYAPDATCDLGEPEHTRCHSWQKGVASGQDVQQSANAMALPWSGNTLGLADLSFVAGRGKPYVLAIVGPEKAGKTTLLAAWYLLLGRGLLPTDGLRFSGSYSLIGWETIASFLRWSPGSNQPTFPPHTTSGGGRVPGLLHLAFTSDQGQRRDYVMTDAPGEWFRKWALNRDTPDAEGARWMAEHADAFLLTADCEALSGRMMGKARGNIQMLARRLGAERRERPVALVWTKTDVSVSSEMEEAVRDAVRQHMPGTVEFRVSVVPACGEIKDIGQGFVDLFQWALDVQRNPILLPDPNDDRHDPLFLHSRGQQ